MATEHNIAIHLLVVDGKSDTISGTDQQCWRSGGGQRDDELELFSLWRIFVTDDRCGCTASGETHPAVEKWN